jgi:hypothetical protein
MPHGPLGPGVASLLEQRVGNTGLYTQEGVLEDGCLFLPPQGGTTLVLSTHRLSW